jgi:predicted nucleic acid-binding protein
VIFLDTSFLFALFARHDPDHERVRVVFETYRGHRMADRVLTTNHVVMETIRGRRRISWTNPLLTDTVPCHGLDYEGWWHTPYAG